MPRVKHKRPIVPCEGDWRGRAIEAEVTAVIPHCGTPDILETCVALLLLQTKKPYILIIDTGSDDETIEKIENLRSEHCEIHYIKSHHWAHPCEPITIAQDLALMLCKTKYMFCTHADCFLKKQTLLEEWIDIIKDQEVSVVGYQISPRQYKGWEQEFGHTALMFNVNDIREHGIKWDMLDYCKSKNRGTSFFIGPNDPDTEKNFNRLLLLSGLKTLFLGTEENYVRNNNEHFDHPRSYASSKLHNKAYHLKMGIEMEIALNEARERAYVWRNQ